MKITLMAFLWDVELLADFSGDMGNCFLRIVLSWGGLALLIRNNVEPK